MSHCPQFSNLTYSRLFFYFAIPWKQKQLAEVFLKIPQNSQENTLCHLFYITSLGDCLCENIKALLLVHVSREYAKVTMTWNWSNNRSISLISDAVVKLVWNNDLSEKCDNNWNNFMDFKNIIVFVDGHLYTQPAIICSKLAVEILEQSVKYAHYQQ